MIEGNHRKFLFTHPYLHVNNVQYILFDKESDEVPTVGFTPDQREFIIAQIKALNNQFTVLVACETAPDLADGIKLMMQNYFLTICRNTTSTYDPGGGGHPCWRGEL